MADGVSRRRTESMTSDHASGSGSPGRGGHLEKAPLDVGDGKGRGRCNSGRKKKIVMRNEDGEKEVVKNEKKKLIIIINEERER